MDTKAKSYETSAFLIFTLISKNVSFSFYVYMHCGGGAKKHQTSSTCRVRPYYESALKSKKCAEQTSYHHCSLGALFLLEIWQIFTSIRRWTNIYSSATKYVFIYNESWILSFKKSSLYSLGNRKLFSLSVPQFPQLESKDKIVLTFVTMQNNEVNSLWCSFSNIYKY